MRTSTDRSRRLGRRRLLGWGVVGVAGTALAVACGQAAAPAPTTAPAATAAPPAPAGAPLTAPSAPAGAASGAPSPTVQAATPAAAKPAQAGEAVTIGYWYAVDSQDQAAIHTDGATKFEQANPAIKIKPELVGSDRVPKLLAAFAAASGVPDTYMVDSSLTQHWDAGMVLALDDRFKQWKYAGDMYDSVRELARARPGAPLGAMPNLVLVDYMYYRTD